MDLPLLRLRGIGLSQYIPEYCYLKLYPISIYPWNMRYYIREAKWKITFPFFLSFFYRKWHMGLSKFLKGKHLFFKSTGRYNNRQKDLCLSKWGEHILCFKKCCLLSLTTCAQLYMIHLFTSKPALACLTWVLRPSSMSASDAFREPNWLTYHSYSFSRKTVLKLHMLRVYTSHGRLYSTF